MSEYNIQSLIDIVQTIIERSGQIDMVTATKEWNRRWPALRQPSNDQWREAFDHCKLWQGLQVGQCVYPV